MSSSSASSAFLLRSIAVLIVLRIAIPALFPGLVAAIQQRPEVVTPVTAYNRSKNGTD